MPTVAFEGSPGVGSLGKLFDSQAPFYAQFRPSYPRTVYDEIYKFAGLPKKVLAVDVGCGNGQVTVVLSEQFDAVIGIDASGPQLQHAIQRPNITYRQSAAEATGLPDQSVDLITAATCLHWFDVPAFYQECRRILRPTGALAVWSYMPYAISFPGCLEAGELLMRVQRRVYPYFHPKLQHFLHSHYEGQEPSAADFRVVKTLGMHMEVEMTVEQVIGWVRSWSCYAPYVADHGEHGMQAMLEGLEQELMQALKVHNTHTPVCSVWPLTMILAKGPLPLPALSPSRKKEAQ